MNLTQKTKSFVVLTAILIFAALPVIASPRDWQSEKSAMNCEAAANSLPWIEVREAGRIQSEADAKKVESDTKRFIKATQRYFSEFLGFCHDAKEHNRILANYNFDFAIIEHALGSESWKMTTNLALQQLTRCTSDYFAQRKGAECQTQMDELAMDKVTWSLTTPVP